jgi:hypothetical protein
MKIAIFPPVAAAMLSGCASTYDVRSIGPDRYQVATIVAPAHGGFAAAQTNATQAAGRKCAALGKQLKVTAVETGQDFPNGRAIVSFECD